ncbi:MAG: amino acid ABC transporter substrate-binding protein [Bdellovibrionales bacterium]
MTRTFIKHCLTGRDNETFDIARVLWALGALAFIGFMGWSLTHAGTFDPAAYGTGFALVMGGGGGSVWAKSRSEPAPKTEDRNHEL